MQRVGSNRNPALDKFGPGKHGFTAGNPQTGTPATTPGYPFFDAVQEELCGVVEGLLGALDPNDNGQVLKALNAGFVRQYKAGQPLPTKDVGPIWHADFNSLMTWQAFNANGANYTGYASLLVGSLLADTQPTPRAGYISSGALSLSRTAYAALRGWAMHNGIMVAAGVWAAGAIAIADNADGTTFRTYDVRGEFPRFWDAGRGVDAGRSFGQWQDATSISPYSHSDSTTAGALTAIGSVFIGHDGVGPLLTGANVNYHANAGSVTNAGSAYAYTLKTRPRNTVLLPSIKF